MTDTTASTAPLLPSSPSSPSSSPSSPSSPSSSPSSPPPPPPPPQSAPQSAPPPPQSAPATSTPSSPSGTNIETAIQGVTVDEKIQFRNVLSFNDKLRNRSNPYTYLRHNYNFINSNNTQEKIILCNMVRALFGCAPFIDELRQSAPDQVSLEFRMLVENIAYTNSKLDITNLFKKYKQATRDIQSMETVYRQYGEIIRCLSILWKNTRLKRLFTIGRIVTGYCIVCKRNGPSVANDTAPYIVTTKQFFDPSYNMEDSLYAERVLNKYKCTNCNSITDYRIIVTTTAPSIITIVLPEKKVANIPIHITLPCEETRTHYYTLASYIYSHNNEQKVVIYTDNGDTKVVNNKRGPPEDADAYRKYDLLFYVKVGSVDNYSRYIE